MGVSTRGARREGVVGGDGRSDVEGEVRAVVGDLSFAEVWFVRGQGVASHAVSCGWFVAEGDGEGGERVLVSP